MDRDATFRVGDPGDGWRPHRETGVQVAWSKAKTPAVIQVRSQCDEHGDSDLASFTDHLRIDFGQWQIQSQVALEVVGREMGIQLRSVRDALTIITSEDSFMQSTVRIARAQQSQ